MRLGIGGEADRESSLKKAGKVDAMSPETGCNGRSVE
jgi:hypothetical protein